MATPRTPWVPKLVIACALNILTASLATPTLKTEKNRNTLHTIRLESSLRFFHLDLQGFAKSTCFSLTSWHLLKHGKIKQNVNMSTK